MRIRPIRILRKDKKGATAIEFAIIALPFFLLFVGIIEIGLTVFVDSSLNSGIRAVARKGVATGYSDFSEISPTMKAHMAGTYRDVGSDSDGVKFRMIVLNDFTDTNSSSNSILRTYANDPELIFSAPAGIPALNLQKGKVVIYAAKYQWDGFTKLLAPFLPDNLYAITVVKNEAF